MFFFGFKYVVGFLFYFVSYKYISHRSSIMDGIIEHLKKSLQVYETNLRSFEIEIPHTTIYNVIELIYDCNKKRRTKSKGHGHRKFDELYIIPWDRGRLLRVGRGLPHAAKLGSASLLAHGGGPVKYPPTN
jgi:hypothetical protein